MLNIDILPTFHHYVCESFIFLFSGGVLRINPYKCHDWNPVVSVMKALETCSWILLETQAGCWSCRVLPCTSGSLASVCEDKPHSHSAPALKDIAIAVTLTRVHIAPPPLASSAAAPCVPPTQPAVSVSPGGQGESGPAHPRGLWEDGVWSWDESAECFLSSHLSLVALGWPISVSLPAPCPGSSECPALAWPPALP